MDELLDEFASQLGLIYLSDLHITSHISKHIPFILLNIPVGKYSLQQWTTAIRYILNDETITPKTEKEARDILHNMESIL